MSARNRGPAPAREPSRGSRTASLIAAVAVLALLAVAGAAALHTGHHSSRHPSPPPASPTNPATEPSTATGFTTPTTDQLGRRVDLPNNPAGQPLPQTAPQHQPGDPDWLTAAPAGTHDPGGWQRVHGATVPYSTSDGPTRTDRGVASGWAHTPQGAALAAVWLAWQLNARPGDPALHTQALDHPATTDATSTVPQQLPESLTRYFAAPDAYRIDTYAPDLAVLRVATRATGDPDGAPQWIATQLVTVWVDGDWRLQPPATPEPTTQTISSLIGWTSW